jgi:hypothetical protein
MAQGIRGRLEHCLETFLCMQTEHLLQSCSHDTASPLQQVCQRISSNSCSRFPFDYRQILRDMSVIVTHHFQSFTLFLSFYILPFHHAACSSGRLQPMPRWRRGRFGRLLRPEGCGSCSTAPDQCLRLTVYCARLPLLRPCADSREGLFRTFRRPCA